MGKHGFSMLEMTVVLGLLAGAGVFVSNLMIRGTKGQKKVSANLDFNIKMAEVLNVLQDSSQCNSTTNLVFKEASGATLNTAKLTNENTPATNTVNWIGYQVGAGATAQNIKVLQEGDVLENTYTVSEITFQRQKDTAGNVVAAVNNAGKSTHPVELVITANPTSGPGFPITKLFKTTLITDTPATSPTNEVVGCLTRGASSPTYAVLGYSFDASPSSANGIGGSKGNCNSGNVGVAKEFSNEKVSFYLDKPEKVLVQYSAQISKPANDSHGTGTTLFSLDGEPLKPLTTTSLLCGSGCTGLGDSHTGSYVLLVSAGTHYVSLSHRVDCGTFTWANRNLGVYLLP